MIRSALTACSALLCLAFLCATVAAQKQTDYRTGRLLEVRDVSDLESAKSAHLLHIRDRADDYFALFRVLHAFFVLRHDQSDSLKPDTDVQYRVSGKSLFLKMPDSKEVKGSLCQKVRFRGTPAVKCGGLMVFGPEADSQGKQAPSDAHP